MNGLNEKAQEIYDSVSKMDHSYPSSRGRAIAFVSDTREGVIAFYGEDLIELNVTDCVTGEKIFWLHMQADQKEAFKDSLQAFFSVLEQGIENTNAALFNKNDPMRRFVVVCTTGMSSQLFASLLQEEADALEMPARFEAMALNDLMQLPENAFHWILTTPQINYQFDKIKEKFGDRVMKISPKDFGTLNTKDVLNHLREEKPEK